MREEWKLLCPPASLSNGRPHGNSRLIRGWILKRSQAACMHLLSMCEISPIDNNADNGFWKKGKMNDQL